MPNRVIRDILCTAARISWHPLCCTAYTPCCTAARPL